MALNSGEVVALGVLIGAFGLFCNLLRNLDRKLEREINFFVAANSLEREELRATGGAFRQVAKAVAADVEAMRSRTAPRDGPKDC